MMKEGENSMGCFIQAVFLKAQNKMYGHHMCHRLSILVELKIMPNNQVVFNLGCNIRITWGGDGG